MLIQAEETICVFCDEPNPAWRYNDHLVCAACAPLIDRHDKKSLGKLALRIIGRPKVAELIGVYGSILDYARLANNQIEEFLNNPDIQLPAAVNQ